MQISRQRQANVARNGFTLVELVVVILVLGIIAAIAAPKMFDTADDARTNSAISSVVIIRDAIELYRAQNGEFPGNSGTEADFKADMTAFLKQQIASYDAAKKPNSRHLALTDLCQVLISLNEFVYPD